jgi:hypothetical protein
MNIVETTSLWEVLIQKKFVHCGWEVKAAELKEHRKGKGAIQRERRNTFPGQNNR